MSSAHTDGLREGALVEARLVAARRDGAATAAAREPRINPWAGDGATAVERMLAVWWQRGYSAAVEHAQTSSPT